MKTLAALVLFCFGIQSAHAAGLPDLGDASRLILSEAQEDQVGREIMRQIRDDNDYLDDPVVEDYLNALGDKLAAASAEASRHFDYFPVRDPTLNAFALPGGNIGVNSGLISATRNESELAGVLAHETAHVTQHHIARMVDDQRLAGIATLAAIAVAILTARSNAQASEAAIATAQALNVQNQLNFTRANEHEADRVGMQILANAGFDPQGMATFFERLQEQSRHYENNAPAYMRTHPLTYQRIADMQNLAQRLPYRQHADSLEFLFVRARIQANEGEAADAWRRFEAHIAKQPTPANWYGLARAAMRANRPDRAEAALAELAAAKAASPAVAVLETEMALSARKLDKAGDIARRGQAAYPSYRPLAYLLARALLANGKPREALAYVNEQQRTWTADARFHALAAEAHQSLGQTAQSHLAQAQAYALQERTGAAIEQLQFAQKSGDADFYTLSIIDARLRELKKQQAQQDKRGSYPW